MPFPFLKLKRGLLEFQRLDLISSRLRHKIIEAAGASIASSAFFEAGIRFVPGHLEIGEHSYVNRGSLLDSRGGISIGNRTLIGPCVNILTATHPIMAGYPRAGPVEFEKVIIESDVWIGAASTILPGAILRRGSVVAAGSVVRGELQPNRLYAGVPAREKRQLPYDGPQPDPDQPH